MRRTLGVITLLATLTLAACGGGGGKDGVASLADDDDSTASTDGDGSSGGDEPTDEEVEQAMLDFAECMREHGIDMPDPQTGGGGGQVFVGPGGGDGEEPDMEEFEAADEACRDLIEGVMGPAQEMTPEEEAEMQDQMLAMAQCMRDHGIDMPDPEFDRAGGGGIVEQALGDVDPMSDEFQEAQEACAEEAGLEGGPGGGPGFSVGGPVGGDEVRPSNDSSRDSSSDEGDGQ